MRGLKGLKKKRRIQLIAVAFVALAGATALIGYAFQGGINLYRSPTQVMEKPPRPTEVFRIGGLVEKGTLKRGDGKTISFSVTDTNKSVPVRFTGVLPDLFKEGQGMVGTGRFVNGVFVASEILAKHDENYMPREVVDSLKAQGVYMKPNQGANGS